MKDRYHDFGDLSLRAANDLTADRKEQIALEQAAVQADKELKLAQQRSFDTPPAMRIALWESRHGLTMPRDPAHPLMCVIAESTRLDVAEVLAEHQRRALIRGERAAR
jgi:hypothetical protein